ncbi:MAG: hypothetical protein WC655_05280, partial [Candidatus Hydrogenedentales bacterium]
MPHIQVRTLQGTVPVSFKQRGSKWYATALTFDLVGTGRTRETAFRELQEVLETCVDAVLNTPGKVRFYNPSDASEWENPDKADYHVAVLLDVERVQPPVRGVNMDELR